MNGNGNGTESDDGTGKGFAQLGETLDWDSVWSATSLQHLESGYMAILPAFRGGPE